MCAVKQQMHANSYGEQTVVMATALAVQWLDISLGSKAPSYTLYFVVEHTFVQLE